MKVLGQYAGVNATLTPTLLVEPSALKKELVLAPALS